MPKKDIQGLLVTLTFGIVWGYFSDIKNGQFGWFFGRIAFLLLIFFAFRYFQNVKK